mmetsp:Transcript_14953/g.22060  ORF Transcript_14953/g.22060 Transcript_14953/m.22060 type:complete len:310 (-) Transcript_14953:54-983(-)|eukprot:CAMPEP_0195543538 /NCGR_PEP_ID=MMETSP0794_2-20130614/52167_1 /TAXON_ID=515487 /ORGANISM="Stephanopyxis turris, Strain CCMP 815" /LENGTH=309 /DNA_ID=CAMNT_0040677695 /DNA_START=119 /DNA_END=1048 /DNA_ORIENTATION=-
MSVILATAGYDHKIRFWEAPSGICSRSIRFPDSQVNCLEITPDKQFLAAGGNPHIRLFEINNSNHNPVLSCDGHVSSVTSLGFQRDGRWMFSGSEDGTVKIFDLRSPTYQRSFDSRGPVTSVALHPNQTELISGDQNGSVKVWDLRNTKVEKNNLVPDAYSGSAHARVAIQSVDISERTVVAANNHAEVFVWDPKETTNFKPITKFRAHPPGSYCLKAKISPDCRHLVSTGSDRTARLWDTTTWELTQTLAHHQRWVWDAVFSADSSYLVTASSDHSARLWNLRTGEVVRQYTGHQSAVTCVALNDSST